MGLEPPRPGTATVKLLQLSNRMSCDVKICIVRKTIRCYLPPPSSGSSCTLSFFPFPPPCKATFLISDLFIRGNEGSMKCAFALSVQGPPVSLSLWHLRLLHSSGRAKTLDFTFWESTLMQRQCVPYRLQWGGGMLHLLDAVLL